MSRLAEIRQCTSGFDNCAGLPRTNLQAGLHQSVRLIGGSASLLRDDLDRLLDGTNFMVALLHTNVPIMCLVFASVMCLVQSLGIFSQLLLSLGQITFRSGLDLLVSCLAMLGLHKLLVSGRYRGLQCLLGEHKIVLGNELCLGSFRALGLRLLQQVIDGAQNRLGTSFRGIVTGLKQGSQLNLAGLLNSGSRHDCTQASQHVLHSLVL
mmetsp:Transcript_31325/g.68643  ORF Transcript_31325/g.68643 Transcript_31325/m.68643 type:complete len:209 (-) Transcript_31325:540-1166(-)